MPSIKITSSIAIFKTNYVYQSILSPERGSLCFTSMFIVFIQLPFSQVLSFFHVNVSKLISTSGRALWLILSLNSRWKKHHILINKLQLEFLKDLQNFIKRLLPFLSFSCQRLHYYSFVLFSLKFFEYIYQFHDLIEFNYHHLIL